MLVNIFVATAVVWGLIVQRLNEECVQKPSVERTHSEGTSRRTGHRKHHSTPGATHTLTHRCSLAFYTSASLLFLFFFFSSSFYSLLDTVRLYMIQTFPWVVSGYSVVAVNQLPAISCRLWLWKSVSFSMLQRRWFAWEEICSCVCVTCWNPCVGIRLAYLQRLQLFWDIWGDGKSPWVWQFNPTQTSLINVEPQLTNVCSTSLSSSLLVFKLSRAG